MTQPVSLDLAAVWQRFDQLKDAGFPLADFDPICAALEQYQNAHPPDTFGMALPNRIAALAVVLIFEEWNRQVMV